MLRRRAEALVEGGASSQTAQHGGIMDIQLVDNTLLQVRDLLAQGRVGEAIHVIESLLPADQADVFEELELEDQEALLPRLETEDAADILEELGDDEAADLATRLDAGTLAAIVDEMTPDKAADLLGDLDPALSTATLAQMVEADDVRPLLLHSDQTAGGLMTSEYLAFPESMRAGRALDAVRSWEPRGVDSPHLLIVDAQTRLVGVASILKTLRAEPTATLRSIMDPEVLYARVGDDQESAARLMARYDLVAVPVVDDNDQLVGVITVDDLVEVLEDEATEDIQRIAGSEPLDRPYLDAGIISMVWKRFGWLLLLFVTGTLTGTVMRLFEAEISSTVALMFFVPLLIGTGGNAGSQTTATVIRALGVGDISLGDAPRVLGRELRAALVLGAILAAVAFVRALTWGGGAQTAGVVAVSICAIVVWAGTVGAVLPLLAAKLGIDPALVSGPLMSTLVDATGLLIYFSIARAVL